MKMFISTQPLPLIQNYLIENVIIDWIMLLIVDTTENQFITGINNWY